MKYEKMIEKINTAGTWFTGVFLGEILHKYPSFCDDQAKRVAFIKYMHEEYGRNLGYTYDTTKTKCYAVIAIIVPYQGICTSLEKLWIFWYNIIAKKKKTQKRSFGVPVILIIHQTRIVSLFFPIFAHRSRGLSQIRTVILMPLVLRLRFFFLIHYIRVVCQITQRRILVLGIRLWVFMGSLKAYDLIAALLSNCIRSLS